MKKNKNISNSLKKHLVKTTTKSISFFLLTLLLVLGNNSKAQCASNATDDSDEDIFNVTFGTLNNSSSCSTTGGVGSIQSEYSNYAYAGFAGGIPNADIGCSIPFSVQIGTCGGDYTNSLAIFIDWNNDGDFVDSGEKVYSSASGTDGPHTETGNITVPLTATLGNCKMRVVNVETSTPSSIVPCGTYSWGETEDYFINVTNGGGVAPFVSANVLQLVTGSVSQCATLQQIICIPVVMGSGCTAGNLTQFQLGAGSSSNLPTDVSKIHVFYTGTSNVYTASNEFVSGGSVPTGTTNTIDGSQALIPNATNYFWVTYDMNPTSTLGNLIDGSCTQITIEGANQVPTTTNPATNGTIVSCPCSFSLGNDLTLCAPFTYTLNGPTGFDTYTWTPGGATTQNLVVNTAGTYTCSATLINGGLVNNGNFNSGNTGFTTSYSMGTGGTWGALSSPGTFSITTNPSFAHDNFNSFGDHTTGTGSMLVCNGSDIANTVVWSQTITVTPNTMYNFSAWVASVENTSSEAQLQFSINGVLLGPIVSAPLTGGAWLNFFVNWNSGSSSSAIIKIVDQSTEPSGNDFALDDINFERVCTFSDVITINSGSTATVSVPTNISVCNNGTVAASSYTSSIAGVTYTWSNTNSAIGLAASGTINTPTFTAVNTGTTAINSVITVTPSVGGCIGSPKSYTITVNPNPNISVNNSTTCPGVPTILTASGATNYTWNTGATTSTISVSPTVNTVYTVTGSALGCNGAATSSVTISQGLTVFANNPTTCAGTSTLLTATGATNYTWSTGATTSTISVSPTVTTTYSVTGETSGCVGNTTATVIVNSLPNIGVNSTTICSGNIANLTATGGTGYTWTPGILSGNSITVTPGSTTVYTVTGTDGICYSAATGTVVVTTCSNPCAFTLGNDVSLCAPLSYTAAGPVGYDSYLWTPGGTTSQNLVVNTPGTYTCTASKYSNDLVINGKFSSGNSGFTSNYIVPTVPGSWGLLSDPGTYAITTSPSLVHNNFASFGDHTSGNGNMMVCNGSTIANDIVWSQTITVAPNTNYNFSAWVASTWGPLNTGDEAQLQFSINGSLVGSIFNAPLTSGTWANFFVNWNSGSNSSAVITIVDQNITASGANDFALDDIFFQQICSHSDDITVTALSTPTVTASASNSVICSGKTTSLTGLGANTYTWTGGVVNGVAFTPTVTSTYTVTGTASSGCTNTAVQTVTVNNIPNVLVNGSTICSGSSTTLTAQGASTYTWAPSVGLSITSGGSVTANPSVTTVYTITGNSNGCIGTNTAVVNVNSAPSLSVNNSTICSGQTAQLTTTVSVAGGTYTWQPGNQISQSVNIMPLSSSNYSVSYSVNGCSVMATSSVIVKPVPTISVASTVICEGQTATLTAMPNLTGGTYTWSPSGKNTISISDIPNTTSVYGVTYSLNGCTTTASGTVIVNPLPDVVLTTSSPTITSMENASISISGGGTYLWNNGDSTPIITVNPQQTTTYCATVTSVEGCTKSNCITIIIQDISTLYVPNVFTPNGDGVNDVFYTPNSHIMSYELKIFNRWGQILFSSTDPLKGWDGVYNGQAVPDGVYVYILEAKGADNVKYNKTGHITLIH